MYNEYLKCCPKIDTEIINEKILIFGGSGSLGKVIIKRWIQRNEIMNFSRNEGRQWELTQEINKKDLSNFNQYTGDISNISDVEDVILKFRPTIIIVAACLKHITTCEKFPQKSVQNNFLGIHNVKTVVDKLYSYRPNKVLFVSTDKACDPITTYGYSKALGESLIRTNSTSTTGGSTQYMAVRYGNVLNSSGSIIPLLQQLSKNTEDFQLTHESMTRFIMTLDQSVNLIEYTLEFGKHGEIVIPFLYSMSIKDLMDIFSTRTKKNVSVVGVRCREKLHEDLLSKSEVPYAYDRNDGLYIHISPNVLSVPFGGMGICSSNNIISKECLENILISSNYL